MDDSKKPWQSVTLWAALVTALVPLFPPAAAVVAANPGIVTAVLGLVFGALRLKTDTAVSIKKDAGGPPQADAQKSEAKAG